MVVRRLRFSPGSRLFVTATGGGRVVLFALALAALGAPGPAVAGSACWLAEATVADPGLYAAPEGGVEGVPCPVRERATRYPLERVHSGFNPILLCGARRVCGRRMLEIEIESERYLAYAKEFRRVETSREMADAPRMQPYSGRRSCAHFTVGARWTDFFALDQASGSLSRVEEVVRLRPETPLGVCARYGGLLLAYHEQRPGLVVGADLSPRCTSLLPRYPTFAAVGSTGALVREARTAVDSIAAVVERALGANLGRPPRIPDQPHGA